MHREIEVIRENLSVSQVLELRREAKSEGKRVNVTRFNTGIVEVEIIGSENPSIIDITPGYATQQLTH